MFNPVGGPSGRLNPFKSAKKQATKSNIGTSYSAEPPKTEKDATTVSKAKFRELASTQAHASPPHHGSQEVAEQEEVWQVAKPILKGEKELPEAMGPKGEKELKPAKATSSNIEFTSKTKFDKRLDRALTSKDENERSGLIDDLVHDFRTFDTVRLQAIDPQELKKGEENTENRTKFIAHFNQGSNRIVCSILGTGKGKKAQAESLQKINFYIDLMDACIKNKNYNSALMIKSALGSTGVIRIINNNPADAEHKKKLDEANALLGGLTGQENIAKAVMEDRENQFSPIPSIGSLLNKVQRAPKEDAESIIDEHKREVEKLQSDNSAKTQFFGSYQPSFKVRVKGKTTKVSYDITDFEDFTYERSEALFPRK